MFFQPHCTLSWVFHMMSLRCHITIVANLWILSDPPSLLCMWWRRRWHTSMKYFCDHSERCVISCFTRVDPCHFAPCLTFFVSSSWHCVINWWCTHIDKHCHHQPHSSWFGLVGCFFLGGYYNNHDSCERWSLSWSIPDEHVSPSNVNVPTWCGDHRALEVTLFQFCNIL